MSDTGRSHGDYYILIGGHRIEMVGNQNPMNGTNETFCLSRETSVPLGKLLVGIRQSFKHGRRPLPEVQDFS